MIFNRSAGFRSFSPRGPAASPDTRLPGWCGRGTGSPPVPPRQGSAITSASNFHRGMSHPPDPNHDRGCLIVPVTVSRASSAASGRCRPAVTGIGAVPWSQSRARAAARCRRKSTPKRWTVFQRITAWLSGCGQPVIVGWTPSLRTGHLFENRHISYLTILRILAISLRHPDSSEIFTMSPVCGAWMIRPWPM